MRQRQIEMKKQKQTQPKKPQTNSNERDELGKFNQESALKKSESVSNLEATRTSRGGVEELFRVSEKHIRF